LGPHGGCQAIATASERFDANDGSVWGLNDQFAINPDVKFLSADVRFQIQNRVSTMQKRMYHPQLNSTKIEVMQVT